MVLSVFLCAFPQELVSALDRDWCPLCYGISVRSKRESLSVLRRNRCPDFAQEYANIIILIILFAISVLFPSKKTEIEIIQNKAMRSITGIGVKFTPEYGHSVWFSGNSAKFARKLVNLWHKKNHTKKLTWNLNKGKR